MKKLLISIFCVASLGANSLSEIDKLKLENEILKQRLDAIENKMINPMDNFFKDFDKINEQHIKAMNNLYKQMHDEFNHYKSNSNYASYFQSNEVISYIKENKETKDNKSSSKIEIKTYNDKSKKEYLLKDILKDFDIFRVYLNSKNQDFSNEKLEKFYISSYGFVFLSNDYKKSSEISFTDMKDYLKDDFLKALGY